jgi:hypothetical protein
MSQEIRLDIEPPADGWTRVGLAAPGVALEFAASLTPRDSIGELARAAADLLGGGAEQVVTWCSEPVEYEFRFLTDGGVTRLEVHEFPNHRRRWRRREVPVAVVAAERGAIARAIWRALRRLQGAVTGEAFAAAWRRPFPVEIVERVGQQLG